MKKIKLTQGKYALVDDKDFEQLNQFKWCIWKDKNTDYAARRKSEKIILMHRYIMNCPQNKQIDHKNRNGLDNRRNNLRICNIHQNARNRVGNKNTSSKYKGVCWHKKSNKWTCKIGINNKRKSLGFYHHEKDAARIYDFWANKLFKEFAYLNFPNKLLSFQEYEKINTIRKKSSIFIGVYFNKNKWNTYIGSGDSLFYIGRFENELEAAQARETYIINNNLQNKYKLNEINKD